MKPRLRMLPTVWAGLKESWGLYYENFLLSLACCALWSIPHLLLLVFVYYMKDVVRPEIGQRVTEGAYGILIILPVIALFTGPANAGMFHTTKKLQEGNDKVTVLDFFRGAKRYFLRSWQITASFYVIIGMFAYNLLIIEKFFPLVFIKDFFRAVTWFLLVCFILMYNYAYSFMVEQLPAYKKLWKKVALMFADNPAVSIGLGMVTLIMSWLFYSKYFCLVSMMFYIAIVSGIQYSVFKRLFARYD
ncbi:MAG: DUF624 domain-containing protein [Bacillota bacterium]